MRSEAVPSTDRPLVIGMLGVLLVAAALRFWQLGVAPIWMDEAFSILIARLPASALIFKTVDVHPPLYYLVQKSWGAIAPAVSLARVPAAAFGVAAVGVAMLTIRDQVSTRAALWGGMLLALATGANYFSQDARMYTLLLTLLGLATWGLMGLATPRRHGRATYAALYLAGAAAANYTHFLALPLLLAANLGCLAALATGPAPRRDLRGWLLLNLALLVVALPWLVRMLTIGRFFTGVGEDSLRTLPWFVQSAIGAPALPQSLRYLFTLALAGTVALGIGIGWRRARSATIVAACGMILYLLVIAVLNTHTPLLSARAFTLLSGFVALLFGIAAAEARPRALAWGGAGAMLALMGWSTLREHHVRTKYENVPAALRFAAAHGMPDAPVLTCSFFTGGSAWAADPHRRIVLLRLGGTLRYDARFLEATRMGMPEMLGARAERIDRALGGGYLYRGGLAQALAGARATILLTGPCDPAFSGWAQRQLAPLGFRPVAAAEFPGGYEGTIIIQHGETKAVLYRRSGA